MAVELADQRRERGEPLSELPALLKASLRFQQNLPRLRVKPMEPARRRKASTSDSGDNSDAWQNIERNVDGAAGIFPTSNKKAKRNQGGREFGMHLTKQQAKEAREMRSHGSCWRCQLRRERVCLLITHWQAANNLVRSTGRRWAMLEVWGTIIAL
jgi:hypothetical protein